MKFYELLDAGVIPIIAEIGINHNGDLITARKLIDAASNAGVEAIKFQYRNLQRVYANTREIGDEILQTEIASNYISPKDILELRRYAWDKQLLTGISFFIVDDVFDFGSDILLFDFYKVPSVEHANLQLIECLCALDINKPVLIATGTGSEKSLEKTFSKLTFNNWIPLHCVSNYPVSTHNANLGYINYLSEKWGRRVGYSSHDENWSIAVAAITLGAVILERHITFEKNSKGLDHTSSSTPEEFALLVNFTHNWRIAKQGNQPRVPNQGELLNQQNLGRSLYATRNLVQGFAFDLSDFAYRSPRVGLTPSEIQESVKLSLNKPLQIGEPLSSHHILSRPNLQERVLNFARSHKVALPVRFHDYQLIHQKFQLNNYEFHLSYGDLDNLPKGFKFDDGQEFTVHLPDYSSSHALLDPFSSNDLVRKRSVELIERCAHFAKILQEETQKSVGIVGSFSVMHGSKGVFYNDYLQLIQDLLAKGTHLSLQWLPPFAWYFGGSVPLHVMNNKYDLDSIIQRNMPVVMDTSHLIMGRNVFGLNPSEYIEDLSRLTSWYHISGASGIDGEGEGFANLERDEFNMFREIINTPKPKVIEVWQGHLNDYTGFQVALEQLEKHFND
jgi:N-acetylneuraminate synthase